MMKKKEIQNLLKQYEEKQIQIRADFKASFLANGLEHKTTNGLADDLMVNEASIETIKQILQ